MALEVQQADEGFFLSATGRCPNLRSLTISELDCHAFFDTRLAAVLNDFFARRSKLTKFALEDDSIKSAWMRADSFWSLNLREISILYRFDESYFDKFISSFRDVEVASFTGEITPEIISSMASLPKLRRLSLLYYGYPYYVDMDYDQSLKLFVGSEILQHLEVRVASTLSSTTSKGFIRHCPQLRFLRVRGVKEVRTMQDAVNFVRSLDEFSGTCRSCKLAIRFGLTWDKIWASKEVKDALKEVEEKLLVEIKEFDIDSLND